jgi:hypothetical protein
MAQPERDCRKQGDADHVAENCLVAMPSDCGTGTVFRYKNLLKLPGIDRCELRGEIAQRKEKWRNVVRLVELRVREAVLPSIGNCAPLPGEAMELEFLERKPANALEKLLLLGGGDDFRLVFEPVG